MTAGGQAPTPATGSQLVVNGDPVALLPGDSIGSLLARLDIRPQRVVVEHNGTIHRRGEGLETPLAPGDEVEVVHFVGGG